MLLGTDQDTDRSTLAPRALWLAVAALAAIAGCRTAPVRLPAAGPWPARRAELQRVSRYELKGRVAVAAGGEGFDARLRWVQEGARAQLALAGPFGAGGLQVTSEGDSLSVLTSRGERLGDEDARQLLVSHLGFELPLASLRYWMLGVPDPAKPVGAEVVGDGHLSRLEQGGWQIDYTAYMPVHTHDMGESLPAKVTLQRADVRVRVLVDAWSD
jgi:outer membrane lipoprotein LolB